MANLDFYALGDDIRGLVDFIFAETDLRIFESYSEFDAELREFRSFAELSAAFSIGRDAPRQGHIALLQLWSASIMPRVEFERFTLKVPGYSFRHRILGVGLIQLYLGSEHDHFITESHYGHWSEAGARQRATGDVDAVNWKELSRLSGRIQRHIRRRMAVAKLRARPILPAAFAALRRGSALRYLSLEFRADSPEILLLRSTSG